MIGAFWFVACHFSDLPRLVDSFQICRDFLQICRDGLYHLACLVYADSTSGSSKARALVERSVLH